MTRCLFGTQGGNRGFSIPKHPVTLDLIQVWSLDCPSANLLKASGILFPADYDGFSRASLGVEDDPALTGQDSTILTCLRKGFILTPE